MENQNQEETDHAYWHSDSSSDGSESPDDDDAVFEFEEPIVPADAPHLPQNLFEDIAECRYILRTVAEAVKTQMEEANRNLYDGAATNNNVAPYDDDPIQEVQTADQPPVVFPANVEQNGIDLLAHRATLREEYKRPVAPTNLFGMGEAPDEMQGFYSLPRNNTQATQQELAQFKEEKLLPKKVNDPSMKFSAPKESRFKPDLFNPYCKPSSKTPGYGWYQVQGRIRELEEGQSSSMASENPADVRIADKDTLSDIEKTALAFIEQVLATDTPSTSEPERAAPENTETFPTDMDLFNRYLMSEENRINCLAEQGFDSATESKQWE